MDKITTTKEKEICLVTEKEVRVMGIKVNCLPKQIHIKIKSGGNLVDLCEGTELDEVSITYIEEVGEKK